MKSQYRTWLIHIHSATLTGIACSTFSAGLAAAQTDFLSTRASIELSLPSEDARSSFDPQRGRYLIESPAGSRVALVTKKPNVQNNWNVFTLYVWDIAFITAGSNKPVLIINRPSSSNLSSFREVIWNSEEVLWFLSEDDNAIQQVFSLDIRNGRMEQRTNSRTDVLRYSVDSGGRTIAYIAIKHSSSIWPTPADGAALVASDFPDLTLAELILGRKGYGADIGRQERAEAEAFVQTDKGVRAIEFQRGYASATSALNAPFAISPDGRTLIAATDMPHADVPPSWRSAQDEELQLDLGIKPGAAFTREAGFGSPRYSSARSFETVDLASGRSQKLTDYPASSSSSIAWAPSGDEFLLTGLIPVGSSPPAGPALRQSMIGHGQQAGEIVNINCGRAVKWDLRGVVCLTPDQRLTRLALHGSTWSPRLLGGPLKLQVEESATEPPKLVYRNNLSRARVILDLNPDLDPKQLARVEEYAWEWSPGHTIRAGLYFPSDFRVGKRYPLVIQTHGWSKDLFQPEGAFTTGYAAQALAGRGFFVLQVPDDETLVPLKAKSVQEEMDGAMAIYSTAIAHLADLEYVDVKRVGIQGFSHTEDYVTWSLTREPSLFAAAVVNGESTGGTLQYLSRLGGGNSSVASLYGGAPVGDHFSRWFNVSPSFKTEKVTAPVRFNVLATSLYLPMQWEWYESLNLLGTPAEMLLLKGGQHRLVKPRERYLVSEGNADWFDFWLNGSEDENPSKAAQYRRWRLLRANARASNALQQR